MPRRKNNTGTITMTPKQQEIMDRVLAAVSAGMPISFTHLKGSVSYAPVSRGSFITSVKHLRRHDCLKFKYGAAGETDPTKLIELLPGTRTRLTLYLMPTSAGYALFGRASK